MIPKSERLVPQSRTESERVAITLEHLCSYLAWTERLSDGELSSLRNKINGLLAPSNSLELNRTLRVIDSTIVHMMEDEWHG
jgi:hypothetical protein